MKKGFLQEHGLAFALALFISLWFLFVINKTDFLKADIMQGQESNKVEIKGDIDMKFDKEQFDIVSNKDISWISNISLTLVYDVEKVKIEKENIDSEFDFSLAQAGEGRINIIISVNSIKSLQKLLSVKYSWDQTLVNVSDATVMFTDWTAENLSMTK